MADASALLRQPAACADRLDLVDAAFKHPGRADELRKLCRRCPIAAACLDHAMSQREAGVWGGTSPNARTRARPRLGHAA